MRTQVKADVRCASVAAASVLAKTTRDAYMARLSVEHPEYGWEINKGYATLYHRSALRRIGPSPYHRLTWRLGTPPGEELDLALWEADEGQDGPVIVVDRNQEVRA